MASRKYGTFHSLSDISLPHLLFLKIRLQFNCSRTDSQFFFILIKSNKTEDIFPQLEKQMEPLMKLLASRDLFMCTLRCKTETWLTMGQTMRLLARRQFMSTLRWIPVT